MTFKELLTQYPLIEYVLRLLLSCGCGALIGLERSRRLKEAGIRTHIIVCCASALLMIVSKYGFSDLIGHEIVASGWTRNADPGRVAAQVVTGISFLGAGVIFKQGNTVKGLTTAAGIWATSAIGLAIGTGMYGISIISTVLLIAIVMVLHHFRLGADAFNNYSLEISVRTEVNFYPVLKQQLEDWHSLINDFKTKTLDSGITKYEINLRSQTDITMDDLMAFKTAHPEIIDIGGMTDHVF